MDEFLWGDYAWGWNLADDTTMHIAPPHLYNTPLELNYDHMRFLGQKYRQVGFDFVFFSLLFCSMGEGWMFMIIIWDLFFIYRWERIDNACDSLHLVSAKSWGDFVECEGFFNMNPKFGMSTLIQSIREDINAHIKLSTEVVQ